MKKFMKKLPDDVATSIYKILFEDVLYAINHFWTCYCLNFSREAILILKPYMQGWELWPKRITHFPVNIDFLNNKYKK